VMAGIKHGKPAEANSPPFASLHLARNDQGGHYQLTNGTGAAPAAQPLSPYAWALGDQRDQRTAPYPPYTSSFDSISNKCLEDGMLYKYVGNVKSYKCPPDRRTTNSIAKNRSYSINSWVTELKVGGAAFVAPYVANVNYSLFRRDADFTATSPSKVFVLIDEHEFGIQDSWFAMDMSGSRTWLDVPSARHGGAYALNFADGHAEIFKLEQFGIFEKWLGATPNFQNVSVNVSVARQDWLKLRDVTGGN